MSAPISRRRQLGYALGNAGQQISDRTVVVLAVYFYLPPAGRGLEPQVSEGVFLGVLTVFGLAMLTGRIFDSLADPVVGHLSDRSRSRLGRRRSFLIAGVLPMVGLPVLLFFPPAAPGSLANGLWLTAVLSLWFIAYTVYVAPYLALLPEIAWTQPERVRLASRLAWIGFPVGVGFGTLWTIGLEAGVGVGWDPATAMRVVVIAGAVLALGLCVAPILAVDERRHARAVASDLPLTQALRQTLASRPFRLYLGAQLAFVVGINMIQPALPYVATVLLGRDEGFAAALGGSTFVGVVLGFVGMDRVVARFGPKRSMMLCIGCFAVAVCGLGGLVADGPGGPHDTRNLVIAFAVCIATGPPVAGLIVLPHVLISQLIDYDETRTGANRAAMYFGVQGLFTKWIYGLSLWSITFLLARFGNSPESPLGVVLIGPVAGGACLLSLLFYARYPESEILAAAARARQEAGRSAP